MAIDALALHFLRWASLRSKGFGTCATIGRQSVNIVPKELSTIIKLPVTYEYPKYCEALLAGSLGATRVDSFDYSDFEGCTYVADMNKPLTPPAEYETVIDLGTLEHIFNVPQALKNVSSLCADGGQILHCLPANNFCGHGFWQFSPELFFSLYSAENGYCETEVFLADVHDETAWYEVLAPSKGYRVAIWSDSSLYLLCRTVRRGPFTHEEVQQSDYVFAWNKPDGKETPKENSVEPSRLSRALSRGRFVRAGKALRFLYLSAAVAFGLRRGDLARRNPSLVRRNLSDLLGSDSARND